MAGKSPVRRFFALNISQLAHRDMGPEEPPRRAEGDIGYNGRNPGSCATSREEIFIGRWIGPASLYYTTEKDALVQMRASETNPNALGCLNELWRK